MSFTEGPYCYRSARDAKQLGISYDDVTEVVSSAGSIICQARTDENIPRGRVGMHFHFEQLPVNQLFPTQFDEKTFTPNYKMVAVNVHKYKRTLI